MSKNKPKAIRLTSFVYRKEALALEGMAIRLQQFRPEELIAKSQGKYELAKIIQNLIADELNRD